MPAPAPFSAAASTSALVIRPPRALPCTPPRSTPCSAATRRATGEAVAPLPSVGGWRRRWRRGAGGRGARSRPRRAAGAPAPALIRAITWPTVTVAPSSARISVIVPDAGAGSSMSTLSVEISTTVSPSLTVSPTLTDHSRIVPSVTDSPPVGVTMSISWPVAVAAAAAPSASVAAPATASSAVAGGDSPDTGVAGSSVGARPPSVEISASTEPTCTVSPSAAWILTIVPAAGEGTSASTLSVEISTIVSSMATRRLPACATRAPCPRRPNRPSRALPPEPCWSQLPYELQL